MTTLARRLTALLLGLALLSATVPGLPAAEAPAAEDAIGRTPPRLGYVDGEASFWRPGADEWAPAQVNTPLAPGDELYTGHRGHLELQIGGQSFVRSWGNTQLGLVDQEPDFLQLKVTAGHVALDVRSLEPGHSIEVGTPHAAFTIEGPGYYRVDVTPDRTAFVNRRAGRATIVSAGGEPVAIADGEQAVVEGATMQRSAAPAPDAWDTWNDARTAYLVNAASARYVTPDVAGVAELDRHGTWRTEPSYGAVWVPAGVAPDWAPYSTGRWLADPYYGWTWVDTAPWGWAPYHYGRWVYLGGTWAWAPGPIVARPVYAPALVAFFGSPGVTVTVGSPFVSWVALGWGEPVVPWWRASRFHGRPWWGGWGGPRVVNNVVIHHTTVVNVNHITVYRNVRARNGVVAVRKDSFGRRGVHEARVRDVDVRRLRPIHGGLDVKPDRSSYVAADGRGTRPPERTLSRPVVTRRQPASRPDGRDGDRDRAGRERTREPGTAEKSPAAERPRRPQPTPPSTRPDQPERRGAAGRGAGEERRGDRVPPRSDGPPREAKPPVERTAPPRQGQRPDTRPPVEREVPARGGRVLELPPPVGHAVPSVPARKGQAPDVRPPVERGVPGREGQRPSTRPPVERPAPPREGRVHEIPPPVGRAVPARGGQASDVRPPVERGVPGRDGQRPGTRPPVERPAPPRERRVPDVRPPVKRATPWPEGRAPRSAEPANRPPARAGFNTPRPAQPPARPAVQQRPAPRRGGEDAGRPARGDRPAPRSPAR